MSEQPTQFILRDPLELIDVVHNNMGEPPAYLFARSDASEHEIVSCGGDYVQRVFTPLDRESQKKAIIDLFERACYADFEPFVAGTPPKKRYEFKDAEALAVAVLDMLYPEETE